MTGTLIHNAEILTHSFRFLAPNVRCYFNCLICSMTLLFGCHQSVLFLVRWEAGREVRHAHTTWLEGVLLEMHITNHWPACGVFFILVWYRFATMSWNTSLILTSSKHGWPWAWFIFVVKFRVSSCRQWVQITRHLLVYTGTITEYPLLDFADSFVYISWSWQVFLLGWIDGCLLNSALHSCAAKSPVCSIFYSFLLAGSKEIVNKVHWQIFFHRWFCIYQSLSSLPSILVLYCSVVVLLIDVAFLSYRCENSLTSWPWHYLIVLILFTVSWCHCKLFHRDVRTSLILESHLLCALLVDHLGFLWILVMSEDSFSWLQLVVSFDKVEHWLALVASEATTWLTTLWWHGTGVLVGFDHVGRLFLNEVVEMSYSEAGAESVIKADRWNALSMLLSWLCWASIVDAPRPTTCLNEWIAIVNCAFSFPEVCVSGCYRSNRLHFE